MTQEREQAIRERVEAIEHAADRALLYKKRGYIEVEDEDDDSDPDTVTLEPEYAKELVSDLRYLLSVIQQAREDLRDEQLAFADLDRQGAEQYERQRAQIMKLEAQNKVLREELEFYASIGHWITPPQGNWWEQPAVADSGARARAALAASAQEPKEVLDA